MTAGDLRRRNARVAGGLFLLVVGMLGLSFAAVPLYDLFCRLTGFGGTPQIASAAPGAVGERVITVRLNGDVHPGLGWSFSPDRSRVPTPIGAPELVTFHARNNEAQPVVGVSVYNVTPEKAGLYFSKVQCFCFAEQLLRPGETMAMPVQFFIDPALLDDPKMDDVQEITLSYTFFRAASQELAAAEAGYAARQARQIEQLTQPN